MIYPSVSSPYVSQRPERGSVAEAIPLCHLTGDTAREGDVFFYVRGSHYETAFGLVSRHDPEVGTLQTTRKRSPTTFWIPSSMPEMKPRGALLFFRRNTSSSVISASKPDVAIPSLAHDEDFDTTEDYPFRPTTGRYWYQDRRGAITEVRIRTKPSSDAHSRMTETKIKLRQPQTRIVRPQNPGMVRESTKNLAASSTEVSGRNRRET